jgi:hypothetical protein
MTPANIAWVLQEYRRPDAPTLAMIAKTVGKGTQPGFISYILTRYMPPAEYKALQKLRYSRSKMGSKNPMLGKKGDQNPRWKGLVEDGYGYLTCLVNGNRVFVHRHVMALSLGLKTLPEIWDVHHIDGNGMNNDLDNLALVTKVGHRTIHLLQKMESKDLRLKKSSLWEAFQYTTLQSQTTKAT